MKFTIIELVCLFISISTIHSQCNNNCGRRQFDIETVCGFNGVTYKNPCYARCNDAQIAYFGACSERNVPCGCPEELNSVCDLQGNVYLNECVANCKGKVAIPLNLCQSNNTLQDNDESEIPLVVRDREQDPVANENGKNYNFRDIDYDDVDPMNLYYGTDIINFYMGRHGDEFTGLRKPFRRNAGEAS